MYGHSVPVYDFGTLLNFQEFLDRLLMGQIAAPLFICQGGDVKVIEPRVVLGLGNFQRHNRDFHLARVLGLVLEKDRNHISLHIEHFAKTERRMPNELPLS